MKDQRPADNRAAGCLKDADVQMLADGQPLPDAAAHASGCESCAARVAARRRVIERVAAAARQIQLSPARAAAIRRQLERRGSGATTLRSQYARSRSRAFVIGGAIAATLLLVAIVPRLNDTETLTAAEILGRSHAALSDSASAVQGRPIETVTYDLALEGVLARILPDEHAGRFTVEEIVDHANPGRFRILKLAPDGTAVGGAAEDPVERRRARYLRVHGRGYLLRFSAPEPVVLPVPTIRRAALQWFLTLMQGQTHATLVETWRATADGRGERVYIVEVPQYSSPVGAAGALPDAAPFTLTRGRVVIDAADARLLDVDAAGTIAGEPFSISFAMRERHLESGPPAPNLFDIAPQPDDVILDGSGTANPVWDVVTRALDAAGRREATR